jgi:tetratricopeptide (TPR) repeat protein
MGPIEPAAITAATLLATKALEALGGKAGEHTWTGMGRLIALVRRKVTGYQPAETALTEVERHPDDHDRIRALAEQLAALAAQDAAFHRELAALISDARRDPSIGSLATRVYGQAQVGQLLTVGQARDIYIQPPPAPPGPVREVRWPTPGRTVANLPPRNPVFTGRTDLLAQLEHDLEAQGAAAVVAQPLALHGLGGVGKTQLVLEYGHRHRRDFELMWWINAEQPAAISGQLVALARRLGIAEQADQAETVQALWDELRHRERWLLVFDNAEQPADLRPYWPAGGGGRLLITSRNPAWGGMAVTVGVDVLPRNEAVAFLQHRLGPDDPAFDRLAAALGDLPLGLEQAAAYLEETATTPGEYLDLLGTHGRALLALGQPATTAQTIATTWAVSLQQLRQQVPAAEDLLVLCAFLAADDIPRALPAEHATLLPDRLAATVADPLAYQQAIAALRRYSLVKTSTDALSVHRLVQAVTRQQLDQDQQQHWATAALHLVRAAFPPEPTDPAAWPAYARLLPHALAVIGHAERLGIDPEMTAWLLAEAGAYMYERAEYPQAHSLHERALAIREACLGPGHATTATSLRYLAFVLRAQGDLHNARSLLERALSIRETHLGPDHPITATSLHHLAIVLRDQGDLDGARSLLERALSIRETHLGPDHPDTAWNLNGLAIVLRLQGDLNGARTLHERALSIREIRLGPDHPTTALSLNNLANVLHALGDLDRARTLHERALAIQEAHLSPDHPTTAWSLNGLADVLRLQGDLNGARTLHERALAIREAHLGAGHPETALSLSNLATVLYDQGDLDHARTLLERALSIREARLGPDHPDTLQSQRNLAAVMAELENRQ